MKVWKALALGFALMAMATGGAWAQGKQWTKVRIATEGAYAPWNFTAPGGKLDGFEVDLANELCGRMKVQCEIVAQDWDGIIPALNGVQVRRDHGRHEHHRQAARSDQLHAALCRRPAWLGVLKSGPLAPTRRHRRPLQPRRRRATEAKKIIDTWRQQLKGKTIGVQVATTNGAFVEKYFKDVATIREYKTTEQHDLDLVAQRVDAIFAAHSALYATIGRTRSSRTWPIAGAGVSGDILGRGVAVGLRKGDPELRDMFDKAIVSAMEDGTLRKLSLKWFELDMTAGRSDADRAAAARPAAAA